MRKNHTQLRRLLCAGLLLASCTMSFVSCSSGDQEDTVSSAITTKSANASGEYYFRQIFFYEGEDSNLFYEIPAYQSIITEYKKLDDQQKAESAYAKQVIIDGLNEKDPEYFKKFQAAMESQDPDVMLAEIGAAAGLMTEITQSNGILTKLQDPCNGIVIGPGPLWYPPVFYPYPLVIMYVLPFPPVITPADDTAHKMIADKVVTILMQA